MALTIKQVMDEQNARMDESFVRFERKFDLFSERKFNIGKALALRTFFFTMLMFFALVVVAIEGVPA